MNNIRDSFSTMVFVGSLTSTRYKVNLEYIYWCKIHFLTWYLSHELEPILTKFNVCWIYCSTRYWVAIRPPINVYSHVLDVYTSAYKPVFCDVELGLKSTF